MKGSLQYNGIEATVGGSTVEVVTLVLLSKQLFLIL